MVMFPFGMGGGGSENGETGMPDEISVATPPPQPGLYGRLMYATAANARQAADNLGLSGSHQHPDKGPEGKTVYMPGSNHRKLNKALRDRGLEETPIPGDMSGGMGGGMSGSGMSGSEPMGMEAMMPTSSRMERAAMDVFERVDDADDNIPVPAEPPVVEVPETEEMFGDLIGDDEDTDDDDDMRIY
jgi:hypothetical protein